MIVRCMLAVTLFAAGSAACAETSLEIAGRSRLAWAAFECSALAASMDDQANSGRLFKLGYDNAKTFMEAALAGNVSQADADKTVPWGMSSIMRGPNVDFMIGRLWEMTAKSSHEKVYKNAEGNYLPQELWKSGATSEYQNRNCSLLK